MTETRNSCHKWGHSDSSFAADEVQEREAKELDATLKKYAPRILTAAGGSAVLLGFGLGMMGSKTGGGVVSSYKHRAFLDCKELLSFDQETLTSR